MRILVVSDTSDRTHLGQKPSLARGSVRVSGSTITSFSWLLIEIDTAKKKRSLDVLILLSDQFHTSVDWILRRIRLICRIPPATNEKRRAATKLAWTRTTMMDQ